ncbi:MAG TPA: DegT/DnrJ/EryC1/StrS family aminotransferase [Acidimicrobiales bacterium]
MTSTSPDLAPIPIIRPWLGEEEAEAAAEAVRSGWVAQGPNVVAFEQAFRDRVGSADAVAVSSCTTGLHLALVALGVGPGDEVVVPSFSFIATTNAVRYVGATPVFADVEPADGNLSAATIAPVVTPRTRAVLVVHQGGVPADLDGIHALCDPKGIAVVEDAACAIGSTHRGRLVGADSELVVFSFHPRKVVTTGEGGMITTSGTEAGTRLRRLREHGMSVSAADRHRMGGVVVEQYLETGFNYRMTDIQAAVGRVQLGKLDALVARRRELAARYQAAISEMPGLRAVADPSWGTTIFQSFWVLLDDGFPLSRNELMARFAEVAISTRRGIMASHLEPACAGLATGPLPVTETLSASSIILPLYHDLSEADQDRVIDVLAATAR